MTYASTTDLSNRFGNDELMDIAANETGDALNDTRITSALEDADAEINTYLSTRYSLPLTSAPSVLVGVACDIARYRLYANQTTDEVTERYNSRIAWLKSISKGDAALGLTEQSQTQQGSLAIDQTSNPRVFTADTLRDF